MEREGEATPRPCNVGGGGGSVPNAGGGRLPGPGFGGKGDRRKGWPGGGGGGVKRPVGEAENGGCDGGVRPRSVDLND
jgi:hypothetical protein